MRAKSLGSMLRSHKPKMPEDRFYVKETKEFNEFSHRDEDPNLTMTDGMLGDSSSLLEGENMMTDRMIRRDDWNLCEGLLNIYLKGVDCQKVVFTKPRDESSSSNMHTSSGQISQNDSRD